MMFKGCGRCGGNMYLEEEGRFKDLVCLQCGHRPPDSGQIIEEMRRTTTSERQSRAIDAESAAAMENRKREGYF